MYPQSELDNYKLQVELLQEKLQRSEENRHQLQDKLQQISHKRNEHDKMVHTKSQQKYQQFLDEQTKRNERNKMLMQMLERIDQQAAALSARSERLKMMKLQYEMYFAKLVQSQTMRSIQQSTATATIPVLLPTTATASQLLTATPIIKGNELVTPAVGATTATAMTTTTYRCDGNLMPTSTTASAAYCLTPRCYSHNSDTHSTTATAALPPQHWTLAPTHIPAAMLLAGATTPAATTATPVPQNYIDYLQYPIGYVSRMQQLQLQQLQPRMSAIFDGNDSYFISNNNNSKNNNNYTNYNDDNDMPTLRTFDQTNDGAIVMTTRKAGGAAMGAGLSKTLQSDLLATKHDNNDFDMMAATEITKPTTILNSQQPQQHLLATTAAPATVTAAAVTATELGEDTTETVSSLMSSAYDILPNTLTAQNFSIQTPTTTTTDMYDKKADNADDDTVKKHQLQQHEIMKHLKEFGIDENQLKAALNTRIPNDEKSTLGTVNAAPAAAITDVTINGRQKIDEALQLPNEHQMTKSLHSLTIKEERIKDDDDNNNDKDNNDSDLIANKIQKVPEIVNNSAELLNRNASSGGFTDLLHNANNAANDNNNKQHQMATPTTTALPNTVTANQYTDSQLAAAATPSSKMSIENIENAIYGELVNPPTTTDNNNPLDTRNVAQELLGDLVTKAQADGINETAAPDLATTTELNNYAENYAATPADDVTNSTATSYEQSYAAVEGTTNAEVYPAQIDEPSYDQAANIDYQQYANDPNEAAQANYADYSNYDANQYANAYDPNMYPGYTYDETTGQYTADPAAEGNYVYDQQLQQQQQEQMEYDVSQQQDMNYDYSNYAPEQSAADTEDNTAATAAAYATPISAEINSIDTDASANDIAAANLPTTATATTDENTSKTVKPTSILSTSSTIDKHAISNEALQKKKKRVNFVDSSETDESSSVKAPAAINANTADSSRMAAKDGGIASSESDFDFSAEAENTNAPA